MPVSRIAFAGRARSGKDSIGYNLIEKEGYRLLRFSDPVYELHNMVIKQMGIPPGKYRALLQVIGTDVGRAYDPDIWLKKFDAYLNSLPKNAKVVCTDVRFPNEVKYLRSRGFLVFKIERPDRPEAGGLEAHVSESALDGYDKYDGVIVNDRTIEDAYQSLKIMLELHKGAK